MRQTGHSNWTTSKKYSWKTDTMTEDYHGNAQDKKKIRKENSHTMARW